MMVYLKHIPHSEGLIKYGKHEWFIIFVQKIKHTEK